MAGNFRNAGRPDRAYVWVWLPGADEPVVAGQLRTEGDIVTFNYGRSYLARPDAIPLYLPERRRLHPRRTEASDTGDLGVLTHLLESGSDRIGALDFQTSATEYRPRTSSTTLEEVQRATDKLLAGEPFSAELDAALLRGTSIGGASPKVLLRESVPWCARAADHRQAVGRLRPVPSREGRGRRHGPGPARGPQRRRHPAHGVPRP